MCLCFLLFVSLTIAPFYVIGQESYGAYAGLPAEGVNGAGIAGNGANSDREGEITRGASIRKAPIAPVAPPRVPLPFSFGEDDEIPGYRKAPPPPTRREVRSEGQCQFDSNKWRILPQSAVANAIMFDRTSGIQCNECLDLCTFKYQDPSNAWICRSVTYDHRWKICDLFAVNGTTKPYFLVDFMGRDYFDFLAALPPTDSQLKGIHGLPPAEIGNAAPPFQNAVVNENGQQALVNLTERDTSKAEDGTRGEDRQCLCPCKLLADKTAHFESEIGNLTEGNTDDVNSNQLPLAPPTQTPPPAGPSLVAVPISDSVTAPPPLKLAAPIAPETLSINSSSTTENIASSNATNVENKSEDGTFPPLPTDPNTSPTSTPTPPLPDTSSSPSPPLPDTSSSPSPPLPDTSSSPSPPLPDTSSSPSPPLPDTSSSPSPPLPDTSSSPSPPLPDTSSSPSPPLPDTSSSPSPPLPDTSSSPSSPLPDTSSSPSAPPAQPPAVQPDLASSPPVSAPLNNDDSLFQSASTTTASSSVPPSADANVSLPISSNSSSSESTGHRALSSKTFQQQPFREIRVPFHKTLEKLNRMGGSSSAKRPGKTHEVPKACPKKGQLAHYVEVSDHQRLLTARRGGTNSIEEIGAKDVAECMDACDAPIRLSNCNSAVFSAAHRCELSSSAANHSAPDSLLAAPKFKYVEKICLDASLSRGDDKRRVFPAAIGYILVGHVQEVFNAVSLSECIKACLIAESSYGFVCKSMMFYPTDTDQNCLMNSESRYSQSEVFVPEDQNVHMLYVDMEQPRLPPSPLPLPEDERRRLKDIPLGGRPGKDIDEEWTRWSKCVNSSASMLPEMRHRYQKCHDAKDVRKCPKESVPCRKMPKLLRIQRIWNASFPSESAATNTADGRRTSDCLAVRDALGLKRCPFGMRWTGTQREFCSKPIDC